MKVWCVIQGATYEGEWFDTLRVFTTKKRAEAYVEKLREKPGRFDVFVEPRILNSEELPQKEGVK